MLGLSTRPSTASEAASPRRASARRIEWTSAVVGWPQRKIRRGLPPRRFFLGRGLLGITRRRRPRARARDSTGPAASARPAGGGGDRAAPRRVARQSMSWRSTSARTSGGSSLSVSRSTSAPSMPASTGGAGGSGSGSGAGRAGGRLASRGRRGRGGAREGRINSVLRRRERRRDALALAGLEV